MLLTSPHIQSSSRLFTKNRKIQKKKKGGKEKMIYAFEFVFLVFSPSYIVYAIITQRLTKCQTRYISLSLTYIFLGLQKQRK